MEQRVSEYYTTQPCILQYCLDAENERAPEIIAVALAILNRKNVVLRPEYRVSLLGRVGVPPKDSEIDWYSWVNTSYIKSIYFERVREKGKTTYHCYVNTANTNYLLWDDNRSRLKDMQALVSYIANNELQFEDFAEYFEDINENFADVEIISNMY